MSCLSGRVVYFICCTNIAAFDLESTRFCSDTFSKKKKKKMLLCAQTNPSLVMGTFLSLHCDLWQPAWQICNLNGVAVVQNAAWWATGEEAVEKPSLKDKVGSFSWSIILSDCAFRNASYAAPAALTCNCHCQLKMVEQGENICS